MTDLDTRTPRNPERSDRWSSSLGLGFWLKMAGLALLDALAVYAFIVFIGEGDWVISGFLAVLALLINWVYLWHWVDF